MSAMQDMTKGGAAGHLLRYAVPLMLGNWFQLAYNAVDSITVSYTHLTLPTKLEV